MSEGHPNADAMQAALKQMRVQLGAMPPEAQEDIQTFARSFRNQLAAGPVARIALMLVAAELSIETAKKREAAAR